MIACTERPYPYWRALSVRSELVELRERRFHTEVTEDTERRGKGRISSSSYSQESAKLRSQFATSKFTSCEAKRCDQCSTIASNGELEVQMLGFLRSS
jgi:hypothetical protein